MVETAQAPPIKSSPLTNEWRKYFSEAEPCLWEHNGHGQYAGTRQDNFYSWKKKSPTTSAEQPDCRLQPSSFILMQESGKVMTSVERKVALNYQLCHSTADEISYLSWYEVSPSKESQTSHFDVLFFFFLPGKISRRIKWVLPIRFARYLWSWL